jgi:hypothetical protein
MHFAVVWISWRREKDGVKKETNRKKLWCVWEALSAHALAVAVAVADLQAGARGRAESVEFGFGRLEGCTKTVISHGLVWLLASMKGIPLLPCTLHCISRTCFFLFSFWEVGSGKWEVGTNPTLISPRFFYGFFSLFSPSPCYPVVLYLRASQFSPENPMEIRSIHWINWTDVALHRKGICHLYHLKGTNFTWIHRQMW